MPHLTTPLCIATCPCGFWTVHQGLYTALLVGLYFLHSLDVHCLLIVVGLVFCSTEKIRNLMSRINSWLTLSVLHQKLQKIGLYQVMLSCLVQRKNYWGIYSFHILTKRYMLKLVSQVFFFKLSFTFLLVRSQFLAFSSFQTK